ncbi:hypothetical protein ONZ45_g4916 [Pleurotus djamor]|nr:hypothetical protein ONZ45_g4916 [Pleurotus djamor]
MLSNDVPATPRPRPPGNVRRSVSMKLQTPPPPYASSLGFPESHMSKRVESAASATSKDAAGQTLSPIRYDDWDTDGDKGDWFNEKSREELTELLVKADGLIKERETELNVTSAVCKTLYENNVSLKSKHQALLARIPNSPTVSSTSLPSPVLSNASLNQDSSSSSPPQTQHSSPAMYIPSISPPRSKHRFRHTRRISMSPNDIALLADQNAELLSKIEKLETESAQSDLSGRRALKRLEREIQVLREELEETQARGEALEEKAKLGENVEAIWRRKERQKERAVRRRAVSSDGSGSDNNVFVERRDFAPPSGFRFPKGRNSGALLEQLAPSRSEVIGERLRESDDEDSASTPPPSFNELDFTTPSGSTTTNFSSPSRPNPALISQLLTKITELEETNARIMAQQAETTEKLQAVQQETENMSKVYERLGGEGELRWGGEDGETALYFDEGDADADEVGDLGEYVDGDGEVGSGRGVMRFRSWRRTIEDQPFYDAPEGDFDQSTVRSSHKSFGSLSERGTPSRRGSLRKRITSRESLGRRVSKTVGVLPASHKTRKSVVGLFDPPVVDDSSPTLNPINLETPTTKGHGEFDVDINATPTLEAELGGLGITFDSAGAIASSQSSSGKTSVNHHLRTTSLYDLSFMSSPATTPMHSPSPSTSMSHIRSSTLNLSPTPISASLPSRNFILPRKNHSFEDPQTPMLPGSMPRSTEPSMPKQDYDNVSDEPTQDSSTFKDDVLLPDPNKGSKHSLRYRRMTQTVRSRAEKLEDGRFSESLKGLGSPPSTLGKAAGGSVRSIRRRKSTLANAFDVFMEAFADTMDTQNEGGGSVDGPTFMESDLGIHDASFSEEPHDSELDLVDRQGITYGEEEEDRDGDLIAISGSSKEQSDDILPPSLLGRRTSQTQQSLSLHQHQRAPSVSAPTPRKEVHRSGLTRVILEIWLWLQFVVIIAVFLWAMAKRGPKAVLYEAEKRKSTIR